MMVRGSQRNVIRQMHDARPNLFGRSWSLSGDQREGFIGQKTPMRTEVPCISRL
jgi:hypothetical protein